MPEAWRSSYRLSPKAVWIFGNDKLTNHFYILFIFLPQVIVFQEYSNNSSTPIEAKYVFPLDDMAAGLCLVDSLIVYRKIRNYTCVMNFRTPVICILATADDLRTCSYSWGVNFVGLSYLGDSLLCNSFFPCFGWENKFKIKGSRCRRIGPAVLS